MQTSDRVEGEDTVAAVSRGVDVMMQRTGAQRLMLAAVLALASCSSRPQAPLPVQARPADPGASAALDVQVWMIADESAALVRTLVEFESVPTPISESLRGRWRANGIRVLAVPVARLPEVRSALQSAGPTEQARLAEQGQWVAIVDGPRADGRIELDSGVVRFDGGSARLLARSWSIPMWGEAGARPGRGVVVGLAAEWLVERAKSGFELEEPEPLRQRFDRLDAEFQMPEGMALVLVAARPEANWPELAEAWRQRNSPEAPSDWGVGPEPLARQTIGELALGPWGNVKRVVVLTGTGTGK